MFHRDEEGFPRVCIFGPQEVWCRLPGKCDSQGLVLGAEVDKSGCPLVLLARLSDAGACGTDCCGSRTV